MSFYRRIHTMEVSGGSSKGLIVLLVDQSACEQGLSTASRGNSFLQNLVIRCYRGAEVWFDWFDVAVFGYHSRENGSAVVEPILGGSLAGREIVTVAELANNPSRIETSTATIPDEETGELLSMPCQQPVWLEHCAVGYGPLGAALLRATLVVDNWITAHRNSPPPFVINLSTGAFAGADPEPYAVKLMQRKTALGNVVVSHSIQSPAVSWSRTVPEAAACLPQLFQMSSVGLPKALRNSLSGYQGVLVTEESRCFALNDGDRMAWDLVAAVSPGTRMPHFPEDICADETPDDGNSAAYINTREARG
jgi:hypothetical protein